MRGYPRYNFDAFFAAESVVTELGFCPMNPARIDTEHGFDPNTPEKDLLPSHMDVFIRRDLDLILEADAIYMLKGWEKSKGATAEHALAKWRGIEVLYEATQEEDVLEEALRLTGGDRMNSYGPPDQDFKRTAKMWEPLLQTCVGSDGLISIPTRMVALCMIALKLSRETHQQKRDNWTDIAGYARCGYICSQAKK